MIRILWLSMNSGLYKKAQGASGYNGGGWIASLQRLLQNESTCKLGLVFLSSENLEWEEQDGVMYYPIFNPPVSRIKKLKNYYGGYKKKKANQYTDALNKIIHDFHPDIIHVFGMENTMANSILGCTKVPVVVHLQGLLAPYDNAFFPIGFNKKSFVLPFSVNEWILRNGYIFAKNSMHVRGEWEKELFKRVNYTMGRTQWDYQVSQLLAPQSCYFTVNEVLRNEFYDAAGKWERPSGEKFTIVSTLSNTIYKGLDLVLKTAQLLSTQTNINFEWKVVGISPQTDIVRFFERELKIIGSQVNVSYEGVMNAGELCHLLLQSHVYVHPSYIDNSPNSVCEAQLLGIPVIGTNVGGVSSLIANGETGLLVPANAPYELAYLLKRLCHDVQETKRLGVNGALAAKVRHNREQIVADLMNAYLQIIKQQ